MRSPVNVSLCLFLAAAAATDLAADDLPRHGVIGLTVAAPDAARPEDPRTNPPTIAAVAPASAAEVADIRVGDVLRNLDGTSIESSSDFAIRVGRHRAGESVTLLLNRGGQDLSKAAILKPRPYENSPYADLIYTSVNVEGARRRVIVTRPNSPGRHPAVLLIGGLGCYSLDGELTRPTGYGPLLTALAEHGFVTMRVEKTGEGDSEGPPCTDRKATADLEAEGYLAGIRLLKQYDFVDPEEVFIFAHSLGPLIGSLVVPKESLRGFIAAETIGRSWIEYSLENVRRQSALVGEPPDQVDADVSAHEQCAYHFFVLHEPADAVTKLGEQCDAMIRSYAGMPETYMHQIGDLSLGKQWKQADVPVLVIYGTADPVTSADEGRHLAALINSYHPGRATYAELEGMGHDFAQYSSQEQFLKRRERSGTYPFDAELVRVLFQWLDPLTQPVAAEKR
jgi:pimeloyl-ACP methyl ester carboxylesterase